jgi:adenylylsulfate kinase
MVVWLIGLAGAGKTTIGREVVSRLRSRNRATVFIDGDAMRAIMGEDLGHTVEDRRRNAGRVCRLCQYLEQQGIDVVCAILSLFSESRAWNRRHYARYVEVFISVPMEELVRRDQKGLYTGAREGRIRDVVGVDIPFEPPAAPDLVVDNGYPLRSPSGIAEDILRALSEPASPER